MRRMSRWIAGLGLVGAGVSAPRPAAAFEVSGGVGLGGIVVGTVPRLAVSPHAGVAWSTEGGFRVALRDACSVVPTTPALGVGVYNQTSVTLGYQADTADFSVGPSLSAYSTPACGASLCGRIAGVSPGGHAEVNVYVSESFGFSLHGHVDWIGGRSLVLPSGVAASVLAGPVLRWRSR